MPPIRRFLNLFRLLLVLSISLTLFTVAYAQTPLEITVFRSLDSLTIYVPGTALVNLTGLIIEATTPNGRNIRQELGALPSFIGLPYDRIPAPICFHITRTVNDPLPLECQTIPVLTQTLVAANIFWYEPGRGDRVLIFYLGDGVQICPSGTSRCDLRFTIPPTPTASPTSTATDTPIFTPTPSATATPEIPLGFSGNPVTSNDQWEVVTQDFDGITMVLVPAGCFTMGTTEEQAQYAIDELGANPDWLTNEYPAYEQCFEEPFWIDQSEVTQFHFERLGGENDNAFDGNDLPVESITWFESRDFCASRGTRLPTEREWEYAARGPNNLIFPWGNEWGENMSVWSGNSNSQTVSVGSIPDGQSWVGAFDMSGNVFEWVSTIYGVDTDFDFNFSESGERFFGYPYALDEREKDSDDRTEFRVLRGGSLGNYRESHLRASNRNGYIPDLSDVYIGFRCAADYDTAP